LTLSHGESQEILVSSTKLIMIENLKNMTEVIISASVNSGMPCPTCCYLFNDNMTHLVSSFTLVSATFYSSVLNSQYVQDLTTSDGDFGFPILII
jgi:hypothetical protein